MGSENAEFSPVFGVSLYTVNGEERRVDFGADVYQSVQATITTELIAAALDPDGAVDERDEVLGQLFAGINRMISEPDRMLVHATALAIVTRQMFSLTVAMARASGFDPSDVLADTFAVLEGAQRGEAV